MEDIQDNDTPNTSLEDQVATVSRTPDNAPQDLDSALAQVQKEKSPPSVNQNIEPQSLDEALGQVKQERINGQSAFMTTLKALPLPFSAPDSAIPAHNQAVDDFFHNTVGGRILDAFGMGGDAGAKLGISKESEEELSSKGLFDDVVNAQSQNHSSFVEGLMKPAAAGTGMLLGAIGASGKAAVKGFGMGFGGQAPGDFPEVNEILENSGVYSGPLSEINRAIIGTGERAADVGLRAFSGGVNAAISGLQSVQDKTGLNTKILQEPFGYLEAGGGPELVGMTPHGESPSALPPEIAEGVTHKAIGVPESTYFGLTEPTMEASERIQEAQRTIGGEETATAESPITDIHGEARAIDPEAFQKYDALTAEQERLRSQIDEVRGFHADAIESELPHSEADIETLRNQIEGANKRKAKIYQDRLDTVLAENEEHRASARTETPGMWAIRKAIQELDYQKRDLAPQISEAYRRAHEQTPGSEAVDNAEPETAEAALKELAEGKDVDVDSIVGDESKSEKIDSPKGEAKEDKPIEEQKKAIVEAEKQKLIAVGRPVEEAEAGAQLVAEHYEARSARFGGKRGTAQEMYERDGAEIRKGRIVNNTRELAQKGRELEQSGNNIEMDMLHGSDAENITEHDVSKEGTGTDAGNMGSGSYASPSSAVARRYGKNVSKVKMRLDNPLEIMRDDNYQANILAKAKELGVKSDPVWSGSKQISKVFADEFRDKAIAAGYDGAIARLPNKGRDIVEAVSYKPEGIEFNQKSQGKIRLATDDAKAKITLMKTANASTFIHETGHHWFDELVRDAQHPDAPEDLKADAKSLLDYANADSEGNISTRGHEKIARSFERYLMEGVAPSRGLARVFAQFKNWLTKVYQTADKLKAPITDDIRDVFDRLLSISPEKTVLAPDHEPGKMMADIHEEEAISTHPEHAAEVAANIEREIDHTAKLHDPEVADAIKAAEKSATTTEPVESAPASDTGSGAGAEPSAGETSTPQEPSPQPASSSDARGKNATSRITASDTSRNDTGTSESTGPNERFGRPESDLVDKAGNIRLDNLNTPEDINQVLRDTAIKNEGFLESRRGRISAGEQLDLADALGMEAKDLNARKLGQAFNAEQILAARKMLIQSAAAVRDAMIKAANGSEGDILAYAEAKTRHMMIQEQVSGITAEAGRALGAFRKLEGSDEAQSIGNFLKQNTGKDLFQLQEEAKLGASLDTPQKISKFINDSKKPSARDMILEYYINALISGPITHLRYSMGNALNALWTPLVEIPTAAISGKIRELITGDSDAERVRLGEAGAQLHGILKGSRDGLQAASIAFKTGLSPVLPGESELSNPATDGFKVNAISGVAGKIINLPSKSVAAIHSFFKSIRYEQNLQALAYRMADSEGLRGDDLQNRITDLTNNPSQEMMESSTANALKELFMSPSEYGTFAQKLQSAVNGNLAAKIIIPFMKIGSQITRNAFIERTPLGLFDRDVRENLFYKNGGAAQDMQLAKMATGVGLMGGMALMTLEGNATGDGPSDPNQRAIWLLNHTPNSIQVGDLRIRYQGLGHLGMLMRFSANMTETAQGWDETDGAHLAKGFMEGITKSVLDENFMRGLKDMLDAVYHPEEYGDSYLRGFATNWLPFSVGMSQAARQIDPYQRDINSQENLAAQILDTARSKIPYVSEGLPAKRDRFGELIPNGAPLPNYASDPVVQRMEALQIGIGKLNRKMMGVPLTDQQFDDYSRTSGRLTKMRLDSIVTQPGFSDLSQGSQIDIIHKTINGSREAARSLLIADPEHPENRQIIQQAIQAKRDAIKNKKLANTQNL